MRRIAINARAGVRSQIGGVERWTIEMAARLPRLRPGAYVVARPPTQLAHRAGHAWEQVALPLWASRQHAGLLLNPANLAPVAWPRNVVVVHDLAALRHPEWYSRAYVAWQRRLIPAIARRALYLVTPSRFSRDELIELLGIDPARVTVIPGGVDARFAPDADPGPVRAALGLERPYVLTVATRSARKNVVALEQAARELASAGTEVVAAGGDRDYLPGPVAAGGVRYLGYVEEAHLPGLYAGARAFALPSRYEGFGLPCIEAMASGTPVVAAGVAGIPEACGGAAQLVDPDDHGEIAAALVRATSDGEARGAWVAAGLKRAAECSWDRAARSLDAQLVDLAS